MESTDDLLRLVRQALDDLDVRPLDVSARRTARLASLLGESRLAVRLGLELKSMRSGNLPSVNAEETKRLMADSARWAAPDGPAQRAMDEYLAARTATDGSDHIYGHSLAEMEFLLARLDEDPEMKASSFGSWFTNRTDLSRYIEVARHTIFTALCSWERRLTYANTNERIFQRFQSDVDSLLSAGAPDVLDAFSAVYRRFRDIAAAGDAPASEELSQAVTSCRRILKAIADHVYPAAGSTADGHSLGDEAYRNRIRQFVKEKLASSSYREATDAAVAGIYDRFTALDKLASKGVHARVGLQEAETCAISTYLVAGELLRLAHDDASEAVSGDS